VLVLCSVQAVCWNSCEPSYCGYCLHCCTQDGFGPMVCQLLGILTLLCGRSQVSLALCVHATGDRLTAYIVHLYSGNIRNYILKYDHCHTSVHFHALCLFNSRGVFLVTFCFKRRSSFHNGLNITLPL